MNGKTSARESLHARVTRQAALNNVPQTSDQSLIFTVSRPRRKEEKIVFFQCRIFQHDSRIV